MKKIRIAGCILALIQFILSAVLIYFLMRTHMFPQRYIVMGGIILGLLPICFIAMQLRKVSGIIASILSILVCCVVCYGMVKVNQANKMLDEVTGSKTEIEIVNVYVAKDDPVDSINQAVEKGYIFGIIADNDNENVQKTIKDINNNNSADVITEEFKSFKELIVSFEGGNIQGFIVNSGMLGVLEGDENYKDYSSKLKIILEKKIETVVKTEPKKPKTDRQTNDGTYQRFCAYLSGIDTYGEVTLKSRSDVNVIAVINTKTHTVLLLSTPRDYYVPLAKDGEPLDKLTHAGIYGIDASMRTLENLYGIDITYFVRVNFDTLIKLVDAMDGLDVYVEYPFDCYTDEYHFDKGWHDMFGDQVLAFCRERYSFADGDNQRGRNQEQVLKALLEKMMSPAILPHYSEILDSLDGFFQLNMSQKKIAELVNMQLSDNAHWEILKQTASQGEGGLEPTYSGGSTPLYVMWPDDASVKTNAVRIEMIMHEGYGDADVSVAAAE